MHFLESLVVIVFLTLKVLSTIEESEEESLQFGKAGVLKFATKGPDLSWRKINSIYSLVKILKTSRGPRGTYKPIKRPISYRPPKISIPRLPSLNLKKIDFGGNVGLIQENHKKREVLYYTIENYTLFGRKAKLQAVANAQRFVENYQRLLRYFKKQLASPRPMEDIEKRIERVSGSLAKSRENLQKLICEKHKSEIQHRKNELKFLELEYEFEDLKLENSYIGLEDYIPEIWYESFRERIFKEMNELMEVSKEDLKAFLQNPNSAKIKAPLTLKKIARAYGLYFKATRLNTDPQFVALAQTFRRRILNEFENWIEENYSQYIKLRPMEDEDEWVDKQKMTQLVYRANAGLLVFNMIDLENRMNQAAESIEKEEDALPEACSPEDDK